MSHILTTGQGIFNKELFFENIGLNNDIVIELLFCSVKKKLDSDQLLETLLNGSISLTNPFSISFVHTSEFNFLKIKHSFLKMAKNG
jgi:hypothetical protein